MSRNIYWTLFGLSNQGSPLPHALFTQSIAGLDCIEQASETLDAEDSLILEFITWSRYAYEEIVHTVAVISKQLPDAVLCLECHDEDESWYKRVLVQRGEIETLDGYIAYPEPKYILWPQAL